MLEQLLPKGRAKKPARVRGVASKAQKRKRRVWGAFGVGLTSRGTRRRKTLQRFVRRSRIRCLKRATAGVRSLLDDLERETHFLPL